MDIVPARKILLVEDEAILALSHSRILQKSGYEVQVAYNGESAIEVAKGTESIDLVLMDINLGTGIDGTQAAQKILELRKLPIVFLTSHSEQAMVEKVKGITRYGYVIKSSQEFVLLETISMAFELFLARTSMEVEIEAHKKTEEELKARNHFIQTILDNLPIGLSVNYIDQGTARYMNEAFLKAYGWSRGAFDDIPTFFEKVYPDPEYRQEISTRIMADIQSGDPSRMKWENIRVTYEDGTTGYVTAQNIPIPEQNFMISTALNVTLEYERYLALQKNEAQYRALVDNFPNGMIALFDASLRFTAVGGSGLADVGIPEANFVGKTLRELFPPEIVGRNEPSLLAALKGEKRDILVNHRGGMYRVITGPLFDEHDQIVGGQVMTQDVSQHHKTEAELKSTLQKLTLAINSARLGLWTYDLETSVLHANEILNQVFGLDPKVNIATLDDWKAMTHPEDRERIEKKYLEAMQGASFYNEPWRFVRADGEIRYLRGSVAPVYEGDRVSQLIGTTFDQTELEKTKLKLEILIKETNHRVKNNLLSILGLVSFTETAKDVDLSDVRNQIDTVRHVHELLLDQENLDHFDLAPFLQRVIESATGSVSSAQVTLETLLEPTTISPSFAVPFGLVVNELVTNAIRHGIKPAPGGGLLRVSSSRVDDRVHLVVENSGAPLPPDLDPFTANSLGFQLIRGLVQQIHGTLTYERGDMTRFVVEFLPKK